MEQFSSFSSEQSFIADRVNQIYSSKLLNLDNFSDDLGAVLSKIDNLSELMGTVIENSSLLLEKNHQIMAKFDCVSGAVDELHAMVGCNGMPCFSGAGQIAPVVDDIRRSLRRVEGDLGSYSTAIGENTKILKSMALDVKAVGPFPLPVSSNLSSSSPTPNAELPLQSQKSSKASKSSKKLRKRGSNSDSIAQDCNMKVTACGVAPAPENVEAVNSCADVLSVNSEETYSSSSSACTGSISTASLEIVDLEPPQPLHNSIINPASCTRDLVSLKIAPVRQNIFVSRLDCETQPDTILNYIRT